MPVIRALAAALLALALAVPAAAQTDRYTPSQAELDRAAAGIRAGEAARIERQRLADREAARLRHLADLEAAAELRAEHRYRETRDLIIANQFRRAAGLPLLPLPGSGYIIINEIVYRPIE